MVFLFLQNYKEIFKFLLNYKVEVEKMRNNGKNYEEMIVNKLNNKKISELSEFWRKIIKEMFDVADDNEIVSARVIGKSCKTDIEIYCMDKKINISVKTGDHNSFHQENIFQLLDFLHKSGYLVSRYSLAFLTAYKLAPISNEYLLCSSV